MQPKSKCRRCRRCRFQSPASKSKDETLAPQERVVDLKFVYLQILTFFFDFSWLVYSSGDGCRRCSCRRRRRPLIVVGFFFSAFYPLL